MYCCTPKALYNHVGGGGFSPQPPPVCSIHLDDATVATGQQRLCAHQLQVERRESPRAKSSGCSMQNISKLLGSVLTLNERMQPLSPEGSQMLFYVWFEFTSWLRGVGQGKGAWDRFLTIWARQLCFCLYDNVKINGSDYWEIQPLFCKWLCPGQMWIR